MVPQKSCWSLNVGAHLVIAGWAPYTVGTVFGFLRCCMQCTYHVDTQDTNM